MKREAEIAAMRDFEARQGVKRLPERRAPALRRASMTAQPNSKARRSGLKRPF